MLFQIEIMNGQKLPIRKFRGETPNSNIFNIEKYRYYPQKLTIRNIQLVRNIQEQESTDCLVGPMIGSLKVIGPWIPIQEYSQ